jgi:hypothetical protein
MPRFGIGLLGAICVLACARPGLRAQEVGVGGTGAWTNLDDLNRAIGLTAWARGWGVAVRYDYLRRSRTRSEVLTGSQAEQARVTGRLHSLVVGVPIRAAGRETWAVIVTPEAGWGNAGVTIEATANNRELEGSGNMAAVGLGAEWQFRLSNSIPFRFMLAGRVRHFQPVEEEDELGRWRDLRWATLLELGFRYEKR